MSLPETADYDIPFADHDFLIECEALDLEYGEPETWLNWTDEDRWELGPEQPPAEPYVPTTADLFEYELWLERLEVEASCNARFA